MKEPYACASLRILVVDGHPRSDSFCAALARSYASGARDAGHEVRELKIRELDFDLNYVRQSAEICISNNRMEILQADHLVFVHPVWWGGMPAMLKGWTDRIFQPGFGFEERDGGGWEGLLHGKRASIILTMDTPVWVFRWILGAPALRSLRDATLRFCGISPASVLLFSPIKTSTAAMREEWLRRAHHAGLHAASLTWREKLGPWIHAARPQFYVFPWMAMTAGALGAAVQNGTSFQWVPYVLAWATAWLLELVAVLTNEMHDLRTDRANRHFGPFTGGSRVQVNGLVSATQLRATRRVVAVAAIVTGLALGLIRLGPPAEMYAVIGAGLILGIGYTAPPLRLSYRTLGELDVGVTHSLWVVLVGWLSQGASLWAKWPWAISLPMFFSILPAITLAGLPDLEADASVGKRTLAVRFGRRAAAAVAGSTTMLAVLVHMLTLARWIPWWVSAAITIHAALLVHQSLVLWSHPRPGRINGPLVLALSYMVWFAVGPLIALLAGPK